MRYRYCFIGLFTITCLGMLSLRHSCADADTSTTTPIRTYDLSKPEDRVDWIHITSGDGNEYVEGGARLTNLRGRSFLLNASRYPRNLEVEVTAKREYGGTYAWILPRYQDANNYYEVVMKDDLIGVTRMNQGKYSIILDKVDIDLKDRAAPHALKVRLVGDTPTITVWLDGEELWTGCDETGLGVLSGDRLALETEGAMVTVQKVSISEVE